jgi:aminoglycoside phosphotransferase (APT) family kinase protein
VPDPSSEQLAWAARAFGTDATVVDARGLHHGASPWLLRILHAGRIEQAVLRVADMDRVSPQAIAHAVAAMRLADEHGLMTSRLIASDLHGTLTGAAALLETVVPGSSDIPGRVSAPRLQSAGAALAQLHAVSFMPRKDLPLRTHPIPPDDYAMERRWAARYQHASEDEKPTVLGQLEATIGWPQESGREVLPHIRFTPLLLSADEQLRRISRPDHECVFVHGDVWLGNLMFDGDTCVALVDWKSAGAGHPGVDLSSLRANVAVQHNLPAADYVLNGWQSESGRIAPDLAYWDAIAALNTPTDMSSFWSAFDDDGHLLEGAVATSRRDAFLRASLERLG